MNCFIVLLSLSSLAFQCASSDEQDDISAQESLLPHYLRDDGIRRLARLGKENFQRSLKQSKIMVVLFYFSNKDQPNVNKAWESEEQMLEVRMVFGFRPQCCPDHHCRFPSNLGSRSDIKSWLLLAELGSILRIKHNGRSKQLSNHTKITF